MLDSFSWLRAGRRAHSAISCFTSPSAIRMKSLDGETWQNDQGMRVAQTLVVNSHEFVCLSIFYVSVFIKAHWLLWFSGQCLNRPFLVVSTCVQFKQGAKLRPECVFSPPHWHVWQTRPKRCLDQSLHSRRQDFSYF